MKIFISFFLLLEIYFMIFASISVNISEYEYETEVQEMTSKSSGNIHKEIIITNDVNNKSNNIVQDVCDLVNSIDFTIKIAPVDDRDSEYYKQIYLNILNNKIPAINSSGEIEYFKDLYHLGEFDLKDLYYYYNDLDG